MGFDPVVLWIVLIVSVTALVGLVIYKIRISRQDVPETEEQPEEPPVAASEELPGAAQKGELPESTEEQHTIYAFERVAQVRLCPKCDGENAINRGVCCICGHELKKGGRRA